MFALKMFPIAYDRLGRSFVQSKTGTCGTRAHGRALHPAFGGTVNCLTMTDILGSFIIKKLLNITVFRLTKGLQNLPRKFCAYCLPIACQANIFNVLAITMLRVYQLLQVKFFA